MLPRSTRCFGEHGFALLTGRWRSPRNTGAIVRIRDCPHCVSIGEVPSGPGIQDLLRVISIPLEGTYQMKTTGARLKIRVSGTGAVWSAMLGPGCWSIWRMRPG